MGAVDARHQQLVVCGVLVADRGDHGQLDGRGIEGATGGAASDASAAARGGVAGDHLGARSGAAGEEADDLNGEALPQIRVLGAAPQGVALAAPRSGVLVGEARCSAAASASSSTRMPWRS